MQFKLLHCWDCGQRIIGNDGGRYYPLPNLREITFGLTGNTVMRNPFCVDCAAKPWPPERVQEYKAAVDAVAPHVRALQITSVEGISVPTDIQAVVH